ncbi:UNVERIFIED_CONTAM: hypothetical protein FKN15_027099 [Acipenser sinensis]
MVVPGQSGITQGKPRDRTSNECSLVFIFLQIHSLTNDPSTVGFLSRKCDSNFNGSQVEANGKDQGVYVDSEMSSSRQCGEVIKKANKILGYIVRSVEF